MFFDITYDKTKPEGASTWSQPLLPEASDRDTFDGASETDSDSDLSFSRASPRASPQPKNPFGYTPIYAYQNLGYAGNIFAASKFLWF